MDTGQGAHSSENESELEIPEEQAVEQKDIEITGDLLTTALSPSNIVYVSFPALCKALTINSKPQLQRIRRTRVLRKGLRLIPLQTRGGFQPTNCLRVDLVALWLAGIETNRLAESIRLKIEYYQEELAPVAMRVFIRTLGLDNRLLPTAVVEATPTNDQAGIAIFLHEHQEAMNTMLEMQGHQAQRLEHAIQLLEALVDQQQETQTKLAAIDERTQRLTPAHTRDVQIRVERLAQVMHRRRVPAVTLEKARAIVYGSLKTRFGAGSYKEIADELYDQVVTWLREEYRKASGGEEYPEQPNLF